MIKETTGIKPPTAQRIVTSRPSFRSTDILAKEIALKILQIARQMIQTGSGSLVKKNINAQAAKCWSTTEKNICFRQEMT